LTLSMISLASAAASYDCNIVAGTWGGVQGKLVVTEDEYGVTTIIGDVTGASVGAGNHGVHLHQYGTAACGDAGLHYNPKNVNHGGPTDAVRHVGDFGNWNAASAGSLHIDIHDSVAKLADLVGRTIVIHADQDDYGKLASTASNYAGSIATGNSGARAACCVVGPQAGWVAPPAPVATQPAYTDKPTQYVGTTQYDTPYQGTTPPYSAAYTGKCIPRPYAPCCIDSYGADCTSGPSCYDSYGHRCSGSTVSLAMLAALAALLVALLY